MSIAGLLLVAACSSSASKSVPGATSRPVQLTKLQNHTAIHIELGDRVQVRLDSTYWTFAAPGGTGLRSDGRPTYAPSRDCVPGGGCGTVLATYTAVHAGTARILASRRTCGEALLCSLASRTYTVTVHVTD